MEADLAAAAGGTRLQLSLELKLPDSIVTVILEKGPSALAVRDGARQLPQVPKAVLQQLAETNAPAFAEAAATLKIKPLLLAMQSNANDDTVKKIIEADPSATVPQVPKAVLQQLAETNAPAFAAAAVALKIKPLLLAMLSNANDDTVKIFIEADPSAAAIADGAGRLPLQVAAEQERPIETIVALFNAYPAVVQNAGAGRALIPCATRLLLERSLEVDPQSSQ